MVKWVKDSWRIREVMKALRDTDNNPLNTDEKKAEGLIRDHFMWNKEGRTTEEEEEEGDDDEEVEESSLKEIITKVEIVLGGTQNSLAPGPDSISYRYIKSIKGIILGARLLEEVAKNLTKGIILREWQSSKVVMIPKPEKDYKKTKG